MANNIPNAENFDIDFILGNLDIDENMKSKTSSLKMILMQVK